MARAWLGAAMLMAPVAAGAQETGGWVAGLQRSVIFSAYSPQSGSLEVARRTLSPLANIEVARVSAQVRPQAIDLTRERFSVYLPARHSPRGQALLVFIPPWEDARLPPGWATVLDELGVIFVSAAKSGNEEDVIDRRIPLALLGAYNVMQRYPIDPDRVYIGGFSGGSRVAMRAALAYPDLFRGALLNAGSDAIASSEAPLPPHDLFAQFQTSSRLVYVTGTEDSWNLQRDLASRDSMTAWCGLGTRVETMLKVGHEAATSYSLRRALFALDQRAPVDPEKLFRCRAHIASQLAADLGRVADLIERDKPHDAWRSLTKLDIRYGGLAAPESTQLAERIGSRR
jgi:hypothetical protein